MEGHIIWRVKAFFALLMFQVCHGTFAFELTVGPCNILRKYARHDMVAFAGIKKMALLAILPQNTNMPFVIDKN